MFKAENDKYVLQVHRDEDAQSPRGGEDLGTMVCFHKRHELGDAHSYANPRHFLGSLMYDLLDGEAEVSTVLRSLAGEAWVRYDEEGEGWVWETAEDSSDIFDTKGEAADSLCDALRDGDLISTGAMLVALETKVTILPLYLYDHSGITMNTGGFSCPWDSGQVGWVYCTKDRFIKETGHSEDELFNQGRAVAMLENEVKTYDSYIRGDVYAITLEEKKTCECCGQVELELIESCGGFYGTNFKENGMLDGLPEDAQELFGALS